ncbi:MAG: hypothetical protein KQJ78_15770 [Deltaproteobacteria bacterium]|nr:hypothetical protein [Deltaproteobacteria bacterium]
MGKKIGTYGKIAVAAAKSFSKHNQDARTSWHKARRETYDKSCPKTAFLGLCKKQKIKGFKSGPLVKLQGNAVNDQKACDLADWVIIQLQNKPNNTLTKQDIMSEWVRQQKGASDQGIVDVVYALYVNDLLC